MNFPWETCMTIGTQWSWKPNDQLKDVKRCVHTLIKTASGNGNLLFNVGPMADGRIEQRQAYLLKQMGNWLNIFGESIYGTNGGPYYPTNVYTATRKGNNVYVHILDTSVKELQLPALPGVEVLKAYFINGGSVTFKDLQTSYSFTLNPNMENTISNVLVLQLNKPAITVPLTGEVVK
jgi:alpha-L-fucosidase